MPPSTWEWSCSGLPIRPLRLGSSGSMSAHWASLRGASSGVTAIVFDPPTSFLEGFCRPNARLAARLAFLQRSATAWCAVSMPTTSAGRSSSPRPARPKRAKRSLPPAPSAGSGLAQEPFFTNLTGSFLATSGEAGDDQEGVSQQAQRDVAVPGLPLPDLIMVHPSLSFSLLEGGFYGPPLLANPDQLLYRRILGAVGLVEGEVVGIVGAAADQEPPAHTLLRIRGKLEARPLPGTPLA